MPSTPYLEIDPAAESEHYSDGTNPILLAESWLQIAKNSPIAGGPEVKFVEEWIPKTILWRNSDRDPKKKPPILKLRPVEAIKKEMAKATPQAPTPQPSGNNISSNHMPQPIVLAVQYQGTSLNIRLSEDRDAGWTQLALASQLIRNLYDVSTLRPGSGSHQAAQFECKHAIDRLKDSGALSK